MGYRNSGSKFFRFVTKHACAGQTVGPTDGQNYDPQYRVLLPRSVTNRLQRVLNAAARLVSGSRKFDQKLTKLHMDLHWLDVADQAPYKVAVTVHRCHALKYLTDYCCVGYCWLSATIRSAHRRQLYVPCYQLNTLGRWTFSIAGPTVWNLPPGDLRKKQRHFRQSLKQCVYCSVH